jgi:WD40 repeat protein/Flp pilus assembly protein TadD
VPGYEILAELGRGGMGVVYKARQPLLNRLVALKMVLAGQFASAADLARFRREAEAAASLQHPHIVQIHEVGEAEGKPFFSLELIEGGSLADKLDGTPQPAQQAAQLVLTLAETIHAAHDQGIIHRDLKPANVLLAPALGGGGGGGRSDTQPQAGSNASPPPKAGANWVPKITDFGLAKRLDGQGSKTQTGAILGTPSYMAPEQAGGHEAIGPATDIYALGAILYELVTGRPPFRAATLLDTVMQVASVEPVAPARLQPTVPRDLETVCLKCLQKEPRKRYASAQELADDLGRFLRGEPIQARPTSAPERLFKWAKRRPLVAGLGAAVALITALGLAVVTWLWLDADQQRQIAETHRRAAEQAEQVAQTNAEQQAKARKEAEREKAITKKINAELLTSRLRETEARQRAEASAYSSGIFQAHREWMSGNILRARQLLDACPASLRRWEWYHLYHLFHGDLMTFTGHTRPVWGVAFSPDGKRLASGSWDGTVRLWNAATGEQERLVHRQPQQVFGVAFSPDGRRLAAAGQDGTIRLWQAATGKPIYVLRGHRGTVVSVAFSPDGGQLVSAGHDGAVKTWDLATGKMKHLFRGHRAQVWGVAYSPDGSRLASSSSDRTIKLWDLATGNEIRTLEKHTAAVYSVTFSPDGSLVASSSADRTSIIWDAATGQPLRQLSRHVGQVWGVAFSPDGQYLATSSDDQGVFLWQTATGKLLRTYWGHGSGIASVVFSPDGWRLASACDDQTVKIWNAAMSHEAFRLEGHQGAVNYVASSPDSRRVATAGRDGTVRVWEAGTGQELHVLKGHTGPVVSLAFHPTQSALASAGLDGKVLIWNHVTGRLRTALPHRARGVFSVAFSPDGKLLASAGDDQSVTLWDVATGRPVKSLDARPGSILWAWSGMPWPLIAAGWVLLESPFANPNQRAANPVRSLAFSPDGKRLAGAHMNHWVRVWDVPSGRKRHTLLGSKGEMFQVTYSPDGKYLAATSGDFDQTIQKRSGAITLWDAATGKELRTLQGHNRNVNSLAFTPDSQRLISASDDGTVKIWGVLSDQEVFSLARVTSSPVFHLALSRNGRSLALVLREPVVLLWETQEPGRAAHLARYQRAAKAEPAWRRREATDAARAGQWSAALYHWNRLIAAEGAQAPFLVGRGQALAGLGRWEEARKDLKASLQSATSEPWAGYYHALLCLRAGDFPAYQQTVARLLKRWEKDPLPILKEDLIWTCTLAANSDKDLAPVLKLAAADAADDPNNCGPLHHLGALHYRAGQWDTAIERLQQAIRLHRPDNVMRVRDWLFLAMALARKEKHDEAKQWLGKAINLLEQAGRKQPYAINGYAVSWDQWVEINLVRREAEKIVNGAKD